MGKSNAHQKEFFTDGQIEEITDIIKGIKVEEVYLWPTPKYDGVCKNKLNIPDTTDSTPYEKAIALRGWAKNEEIGANAALFTWITKEWGRIRNGKDLAIKIGNAFKAHDNKKNTLFNFDGIASWSKALSFKHPKERAIYDVRVIYSLNWLLLKAGSKNFFPMSDGQNTILNFLPYENLLYFQALSFEKVQGAFKAEIESKRKKYSKSRMVSKLGKKVYIPKNKAYQEYCDLLNKISKKIPPKDGTSTEIMEIEMILFSIADTQIASEVLENYKNHPIDKPSSQLGAK
jgi:hypothetical protein